MSTAYHSQTDEQSEQMNQVVEMYLRHYVNKNQDNWVQLLSTTQFAYNNTQNEKKMWIHLIFHAFMLQCCNQFIPLQIIETSVELNEKYQVENILKKRMISKKAHYLIKWKKYSTSENTWELKENLLNCARTLQQFEREAQGQ